MLLVITPLLISQLLLTVSAFNVSPRFSKCPAGQELVGAACQACGDGNYAILGAPKCVKCPVIVNSTPGSNCNKQTGGATSCIADHYLATDGSCPNCKGASSNLAGNNSPTCTPCSINSLTCTSQLITINKSGTTSKTCNAASGLYATHNGIIGDTCTICSTGSFSGGLVPCSPCTTPTGASCSTSTGLMTGCLAGNSYDITNTATPCSPCGINAFALASTVADVCKTCGPNSLTCNPLTGDALKCKAHSTLVAKTTTALAFCQLSCGTGLTLDTTGALCVDCKLPTNYAVTACQLLVCSAFKAKGVLF